MKKLLTLSLVLATLFACENPVSKKIKEAKDGVSNTVKATKELNKMGDDIKELQSVEPLTNEEMKEWLPDEINGMKRTGYKAGQTAYIKIASIKERVVGSIPIILSVIAAEKINKDNPTFENIPTWISL